MKVKIIRNDGYHYYDKYVGEIFDVIFYDDMNDEYTLPTETEDGVNKTAEWKSNEVEIIEGCKCEVDGLVRMTQDDLDYYKDIERKYNKIVKVIKNNL